MSEDVVKDIVCKAIGSNWDFLTELEMWTHYDNALSHQEDLILDKKLSNMLRTHEASSHASPHLSSGFPTPGLDISRSQSPLPLDDDIDFVPTFYYIVEFSTFVVEQAKYIYSLKFGKSPACNKPKILVSLSYNKIVDSKYIAKITAKAMLNPSELILQSSPRNLISPVSVPWDSQEYISEDRNIQMQRFLEGCSGLAPFGRAVRSVFCSSVSLGLSGRGKTSKAVSKFSSIKRFFKRPAQMAP